MGTSVNYQQLKASNPYRNQVYRVSPWQAALKSLGFRTEADAWQENMSVQAAEYDAAIQQQQHQEEYDSAASQAERMRLAGLNPDIDPSSVSPGESSGLPQDPSTPMQASGEEGVIHNFVSGIMSCFSTALGMVSSVQGIHKNALENSLLDLEGDQRVQDMVSKLAPTFLSPWSEGNDMSVQEHLDSAYERARLFSRKSVSRKFRSRFDAAVKNFYESAPGEAFAYNEWFKSLSSQKEFYHGKNYFYSPRPETMEKIYSILGSTEERLAIQRMKKEGSQNVKDIQQADYESSVIDGLNPALESSAKNESFKASKNRDEVTNTLRGSVNDILKALKNDNSEFAGFFGFLLRVYSLYMFTNGR